jgi:hypothetical protein
MLAVREEISGVTLAFSLRLHVPLLALRRRVIIVMRCPVT